MAKITLGDIVSGYATVQALNLNFEKIERYLNEVALARTHEAGEANSMDSPLDMGDNDILNAGVVHLNGIQYNGRDLLQWIEESITYLDELQDNVTELHDNVINLTDEFKDKYYGSHPSHPNTNPFTGGPLDQGALYFNSVVKAIYVYDSVTGWKDGGKGAKGDKGDMPSYNWNGTEVQFELPDGTFGPAVDLKGPKGDRGEKGDTGEKGNPGDSFAIDAVGTLADRDTYDNEPEGFSFYAEDVAVEVSETPGFTKMPYDPSNSYELDFEPVGEQTLLVYVNNIVQSPEAYTVSYDAVTRISTVHIEMEEDDILMCREVFNTPGFGAVYVKMSDDAGDWSNPIPFGRGPKGFKGDKGDIGDIPAHVWDGTSLSFQKKDGTMGEPVNLVGPQGPRGFPGTNGTNGIDGVTGNSAYEDAVALGYEGSLPDWIASLKGEPGKDGKDGNDAELPQNTEGKVKGLKDGQWVDVLQDLPVATGTKLGGIKAKVEGKTLYISLGSADA